MERLPFFQNIVFSTTSYVLKKCFYNFYSSCQITYWNFTNRPLRLVILDNTRKNGSKFCHFENSNFLKCLFLSTSKVPTRVSYHLHKKTQNNLWILLNCSLTVFMLDITRKNRPQNFFLWEGGFFVSKICVFIHPLGPKELILLLPQYLSEDLLNLYNSSHEVCHTRFYEKKKDAEKLYSLEKLRFFSKICDFNNLLGP